MIGATTKPSQTLSQDGELNFNASLALGGEYDRHLATAKQLAVYGIVDFLASPLYVKLSQPPSGVSPEYAYMFLTRKKVTIDSFEPPVETILGGARNVLKLVGHGRAFEIPAGEVKGSTRS